MPPEYVPRLPLALDVTDLIRPDRQHSLILRVDQGQKAPRICAPAELRIGE